MTYKKTIEFSGNSTIQVVILDHTTNANEIINIFSELGCFTEKQNESYFAMEIPYMKEYSLIRQKLIELEENEIISYAEPVLSDNHQYEK